MNLSTIPPGSSFLDRIAERWLNRCAGDPLAISEGLILLPTRRAARALAEAFLRASNGRPLLLPRMTALGALDEAPLALAGVLDLLPAVEPARRLAVLSRLILQMNGAGGAPKTADRAWMLAAELAALMDEAERAGVDLNARLPEAADADFAAHWNQTLKFLHIVTSNWPAWLTEQGLMNPAARQVALLDAQARRWAHQPPSVPVLVAGTTSGIPAVARLLQVVADSPHGEVVFPGLDLDLPDEAWEALNEAHPQFGMRRLLAAMGATRGDVRPWTEPTDAVLAGRTDLLRTALLPAGALDAWQKAVPAELAGLRRLDAADQQEEAVAIALVLRKALETPGARAALVTPDRGLAGRVAAELLRFGVVADDSAGERLADAPPASFLRLLARAIAEELAPVPLLALLKHPLAAAGLTPATCRAAVRALELACLRGPRPARGLTGLRLALERSRTPPAQREEPARLLARLEACLEPLLRTTAAVMVAPSEAMNALIKAAERLAATDQTPGAARLWAAEEGEALANRLAEVGAALPLLPDQPRAILPGLLDAVLEGAVVRSRRALRGREGGAEHARIFIWGLLEARLQSADVIVLGGLTEGVWPPATEPGPWMSRPMRTRVGLPSPEERVGEAAHDFVSVTCAAPSVVLSVPRRRDGAPAVPARWLERLRALLAGRGLEIEPHPAAGWVRQLDRSAGPPAPVAPPRPRPPVRLRPRRLSVTEIETWLRDPYAIYALHVLRLRRLDPLDQPIEMAGYGLVVHAGLHRFVQEHGLTLPPDAGTLLQRALDRALMEAGMREALVAWWEPRIKRIAAWVAATEIARRVDGPPAAILSEVKASCDFVRPYAPFTLVGRADRIERGQDGALTILDYKTGFVPLRKDVEAGLAPQLPLEAVMALEGAFGEEWRAAARELTYWRLSGGYHPGEEIVLSREPAKTAHVIGIARAGLLGLVDAFDDPERAYLAQPRPGCAPRFPVYDQLARVAEWAAAGDES